MGVALLGGHQPIFYGHGLQQGKRHRLGNLAGFIVVVRAVTCLSLVEKCSFPSALDLISLHLVTRCLRNAHHPTCKAQPISHHVVDIKNTTSRRVGTCILTQEGFLLMARESYGRDVLTISHPFLFYFLPSFTMG